MGFHHPSLSVQGGGIIPVLAAEDMEVMVFHIEILPMNHDNNGITVHIVEGMPPHVPMWDSAPCVVDVEVIASYGHLLTHRERRARLSALGVFKWLPCRGWCMRAF